MIFWFLLRPRVETLTVWWGSLQIMGRCQDRSTARKNLRSTIGYTSDSRLYAQGSLPLDYLGFHFFGGPRRRFTSLNLQLLCKFSSWKGSSLSLAGRQCLIIRPLLLLWFIRWCFTDDKGTYWRRWRSLCEISFGHRILTKGIIWTVYWAKCCSRWRKEDWGPFDYACKWSYIFKLTLDVQRCYSKDVCLLHQYYLTSQGRTKTYSMVFPLSTLVLIIICPIWGSVQTG